MLVDEESNGKDWAIIRLDRATSGRSPADISVNSWTRSLGTPLALIGYPSTIPLKLDLTGEITRVSPSSNAVSFNGTVDSFGGNSGSGVFAHDGKLRGILTAGQLDYVFDARSGCRRVNVEPQNSRNAETIHIAYMAVEKLCDSYSEEYPSLCGVGLVTDSEPSSNSCVDSCGEQAAGGCWCDGTCENFGDCCEDFIAICTETEPAQDSGVSECNETVESSVEPNAWVNHGPFVAEPDELFTAVMSGTGDADLYVRIGAPPTTSSWDCRPFTNNSNEQCSLEIDSSGVEIYVGVRGFQNSDFSLELGWACVEP